MEFSKSVIVLFLRIETLALRLIKELGLKKGFSGRPAIEGFSEFSVNNRFDANYEFEFISLQIPLIKKRNAQEMSTMLFII